MYRKQNYVWKPTVSFDELNSHLGVLAAQASFSSVSHYSEAIQSELICDGFAPRSWKGTPEFPMPKWDEELVGQLEQPDRPAGTSNSPRTKEFCAYRGCVSRKAHIATWRERSVAAQNAGWSH